MPPKRSQRGREENEENDVGFDEDDSVAKADTLVVFDRGVHKEAKICVVCQRPFTWRKKWEKCWDDVTTCSDACKRECKRERKKLDKANRDGEAALSPHVPNSIIGSVGAEHVLGCDSRSPAQGSKHRRKTCAVCKEGVELAYRVKYTGEESETWTFVCRSCWPRISGTSYLEKPERSSGGECINDENSTPNPHYLYGGTWKATIGESRGEIEDRKNQRNVEPISDKRNALTNDPR